MRGKKGWILLMTFTALAALAAGCGKWSGNKLGKMPDGTTAGADTENTENMENMEKPENAQGTPLPDIQELTYYVHGTMVEEIWSVSLIRQEEEVLVRVEPWGGEEEKIFDYPVD